MHFSIFTKQRDATLAVSGHTENIRRLPLLSVDKQSENNTHEYIFQKMNAGARGVWQFFALIFGISFFRQSIKSFLYYLFYNISFF